MTCAILYSFVDAGNEVDMKLHETEAAYSVQTGRPNKHAAVTTARFILIAFKHDDYCFLERVAVYSGINLGCFGRNSCLSRSDVIAP
jgi:hypothetical protein